MLVKTGAQGVCSYMYGAESDCICSDAHWAVILEGNWTLQAACTHLIHVCTASLCSPEHLLLKCLRLVRWPLLSFSTLTN